ncbi:hypothetical protein BAUCODRAFT_506580 [Baudoinia panamericana UAMH 10762]|uniref:Phosphoribosylaminoimidazole carboxylase n=1 Tax=Baudoinia panamericana (strain UAMH 10762) TaxID=717646 RepID=M2MWC3_BAUPA|nr:uncharacterized protein BAUCODRAFT_506580 [Baudoinia panamericana UAMH 10762]EMC95853.1 hypothetical protein BAUCODRAFT_506580 [Baudoinia panamericana UAMH 10762]
MALPTVGVLGGGQLGQMLVQAAYPLGVKVNILDAGHSPAKQVSYHSDHIDGSFKDPEAIKRLAAISDVVTVEIEHVDTHILEHIADQTDVQPSWTTIRKIQDKYAQKEHLHAHGVATAQSIPLSNPSVEAVEQASKTLGLPLMLKSRREAYDGRGNFPVRTVEDFQPALDALGKNKDLYAEKWADFRMELAVMVVKTKNEVLSFPTTETIHENSICKLTYTPARGVSDATSEKAQDLARRAVACFEGKGVFGVEMFLLKDETLLINEIAPRPHNSGHYTIEACPASQYDAHLNAILDLPLAAEALRLCEPAIMLNILGGDSPDSHLQFAAEARKHLRGRGRVHLYGKGQARKGRKMGHVTVTAPSMYEAETLMQPLIDYVDETASRARSVGQSPHAHPPVAVIMGSDSDLNVLRPGLDILKTFNIPHAVRIRSAHRTPTWMADFASTAAANGVQVIIAAAGGAAHLPGMAAAHTTLPVIGVPVKPSIGDGTDSLLSICNMPNGVPVATVSVNKSVNAALLAARILGVRDERVRREVEVKDGRLQEMGPDAYAEKYLAKK